MPSDAPRGVKRLVIIGPSAQAVTRLRGGLIKAAVARGVRVLALAPDMTASGSEGLLALGAKAQPLATAEGRLPFFAKRRRLAAIAGQLSAWNPGAVLVFGETVLPIAIRAARRARVPRIVALVNETSGSIPAQHSAALKLADAVVTHNAADQQQVAAALGRSLSDVRRVAGAGGDLTGGPGREMPRADERLVFLAAARLDRVKGVHDYLEAARMARSAGLAADFILAGPDGAGEAAIKPETLSRYADAVQYVGDKADIAALVRTAHVFVSPSHREGMPHAVLQAMAASRPIIATGIPGSRDTVDEMVNGTLVPVGDPKALAEAFARLSRHRALLPAMARASRLKAERGFSTDAVNAALNAELGIE